MKYGGVFLNIKQARMLCMLFNVAGFAQLMIPNFYNAGIVYKKAAIALLCASVAALVTLLLLAKSYIPERGGGHAGLLTDNKTEETCIVNDGIFKKFIIADMAFVAADIFLLFCCAAEGFVFSDSALTALLVAEATICGLALAVWTGYIAFRTVYWVIGTCCTCAFIDSLSRKEEPDMLDNISASLLKNRDLMIS